MGITHYWLPTTLDNVLGPGPWAQNKPSEREKAERHHGAFVALINKAAGETHNAVLEACARFYANPAAVDKARAAFTEVKAGTLVALSVGGPVVDFEPVQTFWRRHYVAAFNERMEGTRGECMICGKTGVIAPTHEKIKGASSLGGQAAGVALMSFDKEAFRSYGWDQNRNSPVSPDRALAYVLALSDLMRVSGGADGKRRRKDIGGIGFLYWLRDPADFDPFQALDPPDLSTVEALLQLQAVEVDANQFYMAGVSGNGGRLRLRYWVADSLEHIKTNLRLWREQLRVAYPWDDSGPVRIWQLLSAIDREGKPSAHHTLALLRRAIEGASQPLGYGMLSIALGRVRHPEEGNPASGRRDPKALQSLRIPMGLVRLCVNDIHRKKGVNEMSEGLDPNCPFPAYLCGRLMYEFENLQSVSNEGQINSSVLDRYFSVASTYPTVAFPKLMVLGQKHLRKLRRDRPAVAYRIDERLREIHNKLTPEKDGPYPAKLSLEDQGLFMLGYYHQKAWSVTQAIGRRHANGSAANENESDQEK